MPQTQRAKVFMPVEQVVVPASPPSIWSSIREALRGSHQDFTTGSLNRAILLLAIPMVLEMVLESLFAVVDVFWVGRLGAHAIPTVGDSVRAEAADQIRRPHLGTPVTQGTRI